MFGTLVKNIQEISFAVSSPTNSLSASSSSGSLARASAGPLDGLTILVCEDDRGNNDILVKTLRRLGCAAALTFADTSAMVAHVTANAAEYSSSDSLVILLDIKMPSQCEQGDEACIRLRNMGLKCRIIAVTGLKTRSHNVQYYLECGFCDVLFKPYSRKELVSAITGDSVF